LDFQQLPILRDFTLSQQLFQQYEYFNGIDDFIIHFFDLENSDMSTVQYRLIFQSVVEYCEVIKKNHHNVLVRIFSYLPLQELIQNVSKLNRKLYIVSGDLFLLTSHSKYQKPLVQQDLLEKQRQIDKELKSPSVQKQQQNNNNIFIYDTETLSFD
jgi:hypothetical protein